LWLFWGLCCTEEGRNSGDLGSQGSEKKRTTCPRNHTKLTHTKQQNQQISEPQDEEEKKAGRREKEKEMKKSKGRKKERKERRKGNRKEAQERAFALWVFVAQKYDIMG